MSYALLLEDCDSSGDDTPMDQAIDSTASKQSKGLEVHASAQQGTQHYRKHSTILKSNNNTKSDNNKLRNTDSSKTKTRNIYLYRDNKREPTSKCVNAWRPRGYEITQSSQEFISKSTLKNDCPRPKYVVMKRDPKLRPLEETTPRKSQYKEWVRINNVEPPSCSAKKSKERKSAEKTTYCRPVINVNEDYEAKVAERNNRLQNIVQKLIEVRQIERHRETWNNFINDIKTRHRMDTEQTNENELIDDYGNVRFKIPPPISKPIKYYIEDLYPHNSFSVEQEINSNIYNYSKSNLDNSSLIYETHPYICYPNMTMREKMPKRTNRAQDINICSETDRLDKDIDRPRLKYKRRTDYAPSDVSEQSRDLTDDEENQNRKGRKSEYRKTTDRTARARTMPYNEMAQDPVIPSWSHGVRKDATKMYKEGRKNPVLSTSTTRNNISDSSFKYKRVFDDIAAYKIRNQDNSSHTLEKIENKLDVLIQGISELLQEIKPKCALIDDKYENNGFRHSSKRNSRCQHCIGNDSAFRLAVTKESLREKNPEETASKIRITKASQYLKKKSVTLVDDHSDEENEEPYIRTSSILSKSKTPVTCNNKLEEMCYDEDGIYHDTKSKDDISLVRGYRPVEGSDRHSQDYDPIRKVFDSGHQSHNLNCQKRKEKLLDENDNSRQQTCRNIELQNVDNYERNNIPYNIKNGRRESNCNTGRDKSGRLNSNPRFDKENVKLKKNFNSQNGERGSERNKQSRMNETYQKYRNDSNNKLTAPSTSNNDKSALNDLYASDEEGLLSEGKAPVRRKSNTKRKHEPGDLFPATQHCLHSSKRQESSDPSEDINITTKLGRPHLEIKKKERPSSQIELKCFKEFIKKIRQEHQSNLKGQTPKIDAHNEIKNVEPPILTGTSNRSGLIAERIYDVQKLTKQTSECESATSQRDDVKVDAPNVRVTDEREERSGKKEALVDFENSTESTSIVSKTNGDLETNRDQKIPMLYLQKKPGYDPHLESPDVIFESIIDSETKKLYIDDTTSVNQILNVSRGSSPHRHYENRHGFNKEDQYMCAVAQSHGSPFCNNHLFGNSRIDKIIIEEMNKSDRAKRDIEDILNGDFSNACAVSIAFDVPTSDRATEVTNSLCAAVPYGGNELFSFDATFRTITTVAVNTEPMSILGLLRLSTETIINLLGQVNLERLYRSLAHITSMPRSLPLSSLITLQGDIPGFICNICGSIYRTRSELSLHNRDHNRDCCVSRHLLDMRKRRHEGLFTCIYCGQCFTRAYCCELHQHVCARKRGIKHDVAEKLSILR